jgi:hypothetical protein
MLFPLSRLHSMPNPTLVSNLTAMLAAYPVSSSVANAYVSPILVRNLVEYFDGLLAYPYSGDLLVAEAPGHAGSARTGIPLTSEHVIAVGTHPFLISIRPRLFHSGTQTESTATMVWNCLSRGTRLPAFWNTFPFHPHQRAIREGIGNPTRRKLDLASTS